MKTLKNSRALSLRIPEPRYRPGEMIVTPNDVTIPYPRR